MTAPTPEPRDGEVLVDQALGTGEEPTEVPIVGVQAVSRPVPALGSPTT